jgi:hypothetical protein
MMAFALSGSAEVLLVHDDDGAQHAPAYRRADL